MPDCGPTLNADSPDPPLRRYETHPRGEGRETGHPSASAFSALFLLGCLLLLACSVRFPYARTHHDRAREVEYTYNPASLLSAIVFASGGPTGGRGISLRSTLVLLKDLSILAHTFGKTEEVALE